jgi:hypothetical protein
LSRASAPPQVKDVSTTHRPTHRWSGARFRECRVTGLHSSDQGSRHSSFVTQPTTLSPCLLPPASFLCSLSRASAPPQVKDVSTTHRPTPRWSGARFRAMSRHWPSLLGPRIPALIARHSAHNPFTLSLASSLLPLLLVSRLRSSSGERRQHDASANASVERRSVSGNVASLAFTPRTKDPGTHRSSLGPQPFHLVSCLQPPSSAPCLAPPLLLR